ncbi:hypothetical protein [Thermofilum pendens]|nr:hypothetical protein [Thermofilum pendens]
MVGMEENVREIGRSTVASMLAVAVVVSLLSAVWALVLVSSGITEVLGSPFVYEEGPRGAIVNSVLTLLLVLLGTGVLLAMIKLRKARFIPALTAFAVAFSFWGISELYFYAFSAFDQRILPIADATSILLAVTTGALILKPVNATLLNALLIAYGTMAGALLFATLPSWSVFGIAVVLAAYDLYSVFRGPLKKILESTIAQEQAPADKLHSPLRGSVVVIRGLALGMGDVLVYSMLSPAFLLYPRVSVERWILSNLALTAGLYATLEMLKRRRYMPALPLPVAFSVAAYLAYTLVSGT